MNIGERIKRIREKNNITPTDLARATKISKQNIYKYENGIITNIPSDKIERIALALGVSPAAIMGWSEEPALSSVDRFPPPNITEDCTTFPVIGEIAAGYDHIAVENWEGEKIDIPNKYLKGHNKSDFFVLLVTGESMFPAYQDGDKVLVLKQSALNYSGQIGAVLYDDEYATLKKIEYVYGEDWMRLVPINPNVPPTLIEGERLEHCRVLGIPKLLIREIV